MRNALAAIDSGDITVAPRHAGVVRTWRRVLAEHENEPAAPSWDDVRAYGAAGGYASLDGFFARCAQHLEALLTDEIGLQALLFDDDGADAVSSIYATNPASVLTNDAAAAAVAEMADPHKPLRVWEIGAGTGATTGPVLDALTHVPLDYWFTDVSTWFLDQARQTHAGRAGLRFGLFDINAPEQDAAPEADGPWDVILAGNVLHNALDPHATLTFLRRTISDRGRLVFIESGTEHHPLLISMRFLMSPPPDAPDRVFADDRGDSGRIFCTRPEWAALLEASHWSVRASIPDPDHRLAWLDQFTFIAEPSQGAS